MKCRHCGKEMRTNHVFCIQCGRPTKKEYEGFTCEIYDDFNLRSFLSKFVSIPEIPKRNQFSSVIGKKNIMESFNSVRQAIIEDLKDQQHTKKESELELKPENDFETEEKTNDSGKIQQSYNLLKFLYVFFALIIAFVPLNKCSNDTSLDYDTHDGVYIIEHLPENPVLSEEFSTIVSDFAPDMDTDKLIKCVTDVYASSEEIYLEVDMETDYDIEELKTLVDYVLSYEEAYLNYDDFHDEYALTHLFTSLRDWNNYIYPMYQTGEYDDRVEEVIIRLLNDVGYFCDTALEESF